MIAIPAMDIINGSCVRLRMGDYQSKQIYQRQPLDMAKQFADAGLKQLHLVDLDGAKAKHVVNLDVLETIATHTNLSIDVGGGLQSPEDFSSVFSAGAQQATVGSLAAHDRETTLRLLEIWGSDRLILGADCKDGYIAVSGWASVTSLEVHEFIASYIAAGFRKVVTTDIGRDGMLNGPSMQLYQSIMDTMQKKSLSIELIASGGIRNLEDIQALAKANLAGAIIGKALYEGYLSPIEIAEWQRSWEAEHVS